MGILVLEAYAHAKKEREAGGWKEVPGKKSNPKIKKCYKSVDGLGNPEMLDDSTTSWCSCVVNYFIQLAGGKGTRNAAARSWLRWGKAIQKPVEGCIVIFKRGTEPWMGHVAFFVEFDGDYVICIGGNQSNDLNMSRYKRYDVLGYRVSLDF